MKLSSVLAVNPYNSGVVDELPNVLCLNIVVLSRWFRHYSDQYT